MDFLHFWSMVTSMGIFYFYIHLNKLIETQTVRQLLKVVEGFGIEVRVKASLAPSEWGIIWRGAIFISSPNISFHSASLHLPMQWIRPPPPSHPIHLFPSGSITFHMPFPALKFLKFPESKLSTLLNISAMFNFQSWRFSFYIDFDAATRWPWSDILHD